MARGVDRTARFAQRKPAAWSAEKLDLFLSVLEMADVIDAFDRVRALIGDVSPAGDQMRTALVEHTRALVQRLVQL